MKVRLGLGLIAWPFRERRPEPFWRLVDQAEALGFDSLWLNDRIVSGALVLEPLAALAALAGRTRSMKFGPSVLALPLRHPVVVAKEIATIDFLSGGRMLPVVGLGSEDPREYQACGVPKEERGRRTDEAIVLLRRLWTEDAVSFHGEFFHLEQVSVLPKPLQRPCPPIWIGGRSAFALKRVGRLGDGWLAAGVTPQEVRVGIEAIGASAAEARRKVPADHFGVILSCCVAGSRQEAERLAGPYLPRLRSEMPPGAHCALGTIEDVATKVDEYVAAGASKFVLRLACPEEHLERQLEALARGLLPRYHAPAGTFQRTA